MDLVEELLAGSQIALSRLITLVENRDERAAGYLARLHSHAGRAHIVGITGSPGTGKSTLTDSITGLLRKKGLTVGIIAVDPSSPFTGGALLGDRVRMSSVALDPGVFIRSMATRGQLGGLSGATRDAVKIMDAAGKDVIIIETVGVGQDEVDVVRIADTVVLVLVPGFGDIIQSMKAGVMEIGNIFVVNKCDLAGAEQLLRELEVRLDQDHRLKESPWRPPILKTIANQGEGTGEVVDAVMSHRAFLEETGRLEEYRKKRAREETLDLVEKRIYRLVREKLARKEDYAELLEEVMEGDLDPYSASEAIIDKALSEEPEK